MQYLYNAKVTEVHSGDSFTAEVDLGFDEKKVVELSLLGIVAPPIGEGGEKNPAGVASKKKLVELIGGRSVVLDVQKRAGKYVARVSIPGVVLPVNDYMLRYGLATIKR